MGHLPISVLENFDPVNALPLVREMGCSVPSDPLLLSRGLPIHGKKIRSRDTWEKHFGISRRSLKEVQRGNKLRYIFCHLTLQRFRVCIIMSNYCQGVFVFYSNRKRGGSANGKSVEICKERETWKCNNATHENVRSCNKKADPVSCPSHLLFEFDSFQCICGLEMLSTRKM